MLRMSLVHVHCSRECDSRTVNKDNEHVNVLLAACWMGVVQNRSFNVHYAARRNLYKPTVLCLQANSPLWHSRRVKAAYNWRYVAAADAQAFLLYCYYWCIICWQHGCPNCLRHRRQFQ